MSAAHLRPWPQRWSSGCGSAPARRTAGARGTSPPCWRPGWCRRRPATSPAAPACAQDLSQDMSRAGPALLFASLLCSLPCMQAHKKTACSSYDGVHPQSVPSAPRAPGWRRSAPGWSGWRGSCPARPRPPAAPGPPRAPARPSPLQAHHHPYHSLAQTTNNPRMYPHSQAPCTGSSCGVHIHANTLICGAGPDACGEFFNKRARLAAGQRPAGAP